MIRAQGGDATCVDDVMTLPQPALIRQVKVGREGYVASMDTEALGYAAQAMGAGRVQKTDVIDPAVGYILPVRIGDHVTPDTPLCTLYARNEADATKAEAAIRAAITIGSEPVERPPLCYAVVTAGGVEMA
jgi:thymidine phosphorylase